MSVFQRPFRPRLSATASHSPPSLSLSLSPAFCSTCCLAKVSACRSASSSSYPLSQLLSLNPEPLHQPLAWICGWNHHALHFFSPLPFPLSPLPLSPLWQSTFWPGCFCCFLPTQTSPCWFLPVFLTHFSCSPLCIIFRRCLHLSFFILFFVLAIAVLIVRSRNAALTGG